MKKKKIFLTAVTTVLAASALVSCGKNSSSDNKKDDDNKTTTETLPADMHKVYFIIDGEVVGTVDYKEGASSILEYQVPAREGYIGKWDSYTLGDKDVYVTARYFKLNVNYKVEYYLENLENSQYTISANDTQTFSAKA